MPVNAVQDPPRRPPRDPKTRNAKDDFDDAEDAFNHHDFTSAAQAYTEVKRLYPYSRFAREAELRLADINVERGEFAEATAAYEEWMRAHPTDPKIAEVHNKADAARTHIPP